MPDRDHIAKVLRKTLKDHLPDASLARQTPCKSGVDFILRHPSGIVVGEIKQAKSASIEAVIGLIASSTLRTQHMLDADERQIPLAMAIIPRVGGKTKREIERFMSNNAPGCGWGLTDSSGATRMVIPQLNVDIDEPGVIGSRASWRSPPSRQLFSDLNRWMLKVLLLRDAAPALWNGPRADIATPTELHRVANVSVAKAHQFCHAFEGAGFLFRGQRGLAIVRKKTLMETWFQNERADARIRRLCDGYSANQQVCKMSSAARMRRVNSPFVDSRRAGCSKSSTPRRLGRRCISLAARSRPSRRWGWSHATRVTHISTYANRGLPNRS